MSDPVIESPERNDSTIPALVPVIQSGGPISAGDNLLLSSMALRARAGDAETRDALYFALEPILYRIARRAWRLSAVESHWELEDVIQEGYLLFVGVVDDWDERLPFAQFALTAFRWRLLSLLRRARTARPAHVTDSAPLLRDDSYLASEADLMLAEVLETLPDLERFLLDRRVRHGQSFTQIGRDLGVSARTVQRRWKAMLADLEETLGR